jgi:diguanylate cyclase (GGDEF)-like protein
MATSPPFPVAPPGFTFRQKLWLGTIVIMVCTSLLGARLIWMSYGEYRRNADNQANMAVYRLTLLASNRLASERAPILLALGQASAENSAPLAQLGEERARSDAALDELEIRWRARARSDSERMEPQFELIRHALALARAQVDAELRLTLPQRAQHGIAKALEGMYGVVDSMTPLVLASAQRIQQDDPAMTDDVMLTDLLAQMRDHGGRLANMLLPPLAAHEALTPGQVLQLARMRGRLDQTWSMVCVLIQRFKGDTEITNAMEDITRQYFGTALARVDGVVGEGVRSGDYAESSADLQGVILPALLRIENLRDVIFARSEARLLEALDDATWGMWVSGLITLVVLAVLVASFSISRKRLFVPLLHARHEIIGLAKYGAAARAPRRPSGSSEIEAIYEALDVLKTAQRRRERLEKERELISAKLKEEAQTDALTDLHNRRGLELVGRNLAQYSPHENALAGLILLDVDHFKRVNDTYGHVTGDRVLREVAQVMKASCRKTDIVARYGGEEFAVLVLDADNERLRFLAEKIRRACETMVITLADGVVIRLTVSAGAVVGRRGMATWTPLVEHADAALYQAKRDGRNRVVQSPDLVE